MRDLTSRKRLEEQLQLRQRMDSVGTLTSGIAHDFNNILAGIMGYAQLLAERSANLDPELREYLANISQATQRGADLVNSLKLLSHPAPSTGDHFDLFDVSSEVMRVLSVTTDRVIRKSLGVSPGAFLVRGSSSDLYHAVMNLCINSVQAIEAKGPTAEDSITIEADHFEARAQHPLGLAPGSDVHIVVADTGVGMSPPVRKRAFEPLYSTKAPGESKGQGLGLAMVYNIVVRQHGGAVDIDSSPGRGCRVHLYLPAADRRTRPTETDEALPGQPSAATSGYERILVVEDEPQLARLKRTILEGSGYSVLVATDGREAVELFKREPDTIDLVLLDRSLPTLRGEQVFEQLLTTRPELTVIVSTGDAKIPGEEFAGAYHILQKPYPPSRLRSVVRQALDEKRSRPDG